MVGLREIMQHIKYENGNDREIINVRIINKSGENMILCRSSEWISESTPTLKGSC